MLCAWPLKQHPTATQNSKSFFLLFIYFFVHSFLLQSWFCAFFAPSQKPTHTHLVFSSALANMTKRRSLPEANQTHKVCVGEPGEWLLVALGFLYHTDSSASPIHSAFGSVQQLAANSVLHCSPRLLVALICTCRHPAAETNQQDRVYIQKHPVD